MRTSRAAAALLATDRSIARIAFDNGFASHEVFTRTFRRHFGAAPTRYRSRSPRPDVGASAAARHVEVIDAAAPCVGLYRMNITGRTSPVTVDVVLQDMPALTALVIRRSIVRDQVAETLAECLPAVFTYAIEHGLVIASPPLARYPEVYMASLVIEGGVAIAEPPAEDPAGDIEVLTIPPGPAAVAIHQGPYESLQDTYLAIESWIRREGHTVAGPPREVYITDPGERPDPATWETEIVQPLR